MSDAALPIRVRGRRTASAWMESTAPNLSGEVAIIEPDSWYIGVKEYVRAQRARGLTSRSHHELLGGVARVRNPRDDGGPEYNSLTKVAATVLLLAE